MNNMLKPVIVIVVAIAVAAGAAMFFSREEAASSPSQSAGAAAQDYSFTPAPAGSDPNFLPKSLPGGQGGRVLGNPNATSTLVEFGDFQCPSCAGFHPVIKELMRREGDNLKVEFHHFPLIQIHANAIPASKAAEAAADQGKFAEMMDMLFANQRTLSPMQDPKPEFIAYATRLGLDVARFGQSYDSSEVESRVLQDVQRGMAAQVDGTPTFFVNGHRVWELPQGVEEFQQLIRSTSAAPAAK